MTNRSKNIGTKFETDVTRYLQRNGFDRAKRKALAGSLDEGDVFAAEGLLVECKAGVAAESASDGQLRLWYAETLHEKANARAQHAFLVVKRKGFGIAKADGWWVVQDEGGMLIRFLLGEYVRFLQGSGWTKDGLNADGVGSE